MFFRAQSVTLAGAVVQGWYDFGQFTVSSHYASNNNFYVVLDIGARLIFSSSELAIEGSYCSGHLQVAKYRSFAHHEVQ
jgi:hypothetical protein